MAKKTNKRNWVILGIVAIVLVLGIVLGALALSAGGVETEEKLSSSSASSEQTQAAAPASQTAPDPQPQPAGGYEIYEPSKLAYADNGKVVLFFNAKWCPECRQADKNLKASKFPNGLLVLSVDYDTYTDLKKKYGVTYQHTFVQVDASGNMVKKWSGGYTLEDIKKQLGM
jgi:thiol-disulfide isomerase/thioredoxin